MEAHAAPGVEKVGITGRLDDLIEDLAKTAAGLLGGGALVYYSWNWAVAPAFTFMKPLNGFWTAVLFVTGLYFLSMVWTAIRTEDGIKLKISSKDFDFNALVEQVAPAAVLLLAFVVVHHYLVL